MAGGDKRQQFVSQITTATGVVYNQLTRLKMLDKRFASMEAYYLEQITSNIKSGNNARAKILATELSNVRRLRRTTQHTGLALEAIVIRFSTINEFAKILDTIDPTIEMIKGIHTELTRAIPAASEALSEVSTVTTDVLLNANIKADARISTPVDADALSILNEIEGVLEDEAKAKLPEVPTNIIPVQKQEQEEEQQPAEETRVMVES
ncbi:SNF7 domain-containing protein [Candidatus Nitrososphaera gargensis Ga9.2]|uniref:SNF7 domain-containing protein n=2 Tax=Candidatus Nitrososphaera gargensis TaxID=497727 RepID=K0IDT2_NITGG